MAARILVFALALVWSAISPADRLTWWLEVLPGLMAFMVLALLWPHFCFTGWTCTLILLQCIILFIGGHYTYAEVPWFNWIRDHVGGTRNNFDKVGHFAQGFVPAAVVREVLLRTHVLARRNWAPFLTIAVTLAISAAYELFEWLVSVCTGAAGDAFLGTQGYVWDTQSDILMALIGATIFESFFSRAQDRAIERLTRATGTSTGPS